MQKVPILPTQPWQDGEPVLSTPTIVVVVTPNPAQQPLTHGARGLRRQQVRIHQARILRSGYVTQPPSRLTVHSTRPTRRLMKRRHRAVILKAPFLARLGARFILLRGTRPRLRMWLGRRPGLVQRPPITGVPRDKTIKAIILRGQGRATQKMRKRRHFVEFVRSVGGTAPTAANPAKQPLVHGARALPRARKRVHEVVVLRGARWMVRPGGGRIIARSVRPRVRLLLGRRPGLLLRPPITGVPRDKTIKPIITRSVGRSEQLGRKRRHFVRFLRSTGGVAAGFTPAPARQPLVKANRALKRYKLRRHRAVILRSVFLGTVRGPKPLTKQLRKRHLYKARKHRPLILRGPLYVQIRGGGTIVLRPVERTKSAKVRRHRNWLIRANIIGVRRERTTKPIYLHSVVNKRWLRKLGKAFISVKRSLGGFAVSDVVFDEPFDQPQPTGRTMSAATATAFDQASATGRVTSIPSSVQGESYSSGSYNSHGYGEGLAGEFDIPAPIGIVNIPDPET